MTSIMELLKKSFSQAKQHKFLWWDMVVLQVIEYDHKSTPPIIHRLIGYYELALVTMAHFYVMYSYAHTL